MGSCFSKSKKNQKQITPEGTPEPLCLSQFELRRVIGKGAFGKVKTVVHKQTQRSYALKYVNKAVCLEQQAAPNVVRERKILEILDHPLVCNMRYAFQDSEYLYLVFDLMLGGDLRFHLLRRSFTESAIRHWIAEIASALSYCHSRGIVHRDVKPDNVLLTACGHAKLADFNISTQIKRNVLPQSKSGSLFYMAPEIHQGLPYDSAVDYWSLGVVMYECLYGKNPFKGKSNAAVEQTVCSTDVEISVTEPPVSPDCVQAMKQLLQRDPGIRCCTLTELQALPFFVNLDWTKVVTGSSDPIFIPGEGKNFDAAWELEEILLHDMPLESRKPQPTKPRLANEKHKNNDMLNLIEKHFTDFEYIAEVALIEEKFGLGDLLENQKSTASLAGAASDLDEPGTVVLDEGLATPKEATSCPGSPSKRNGLFRSKSKKTKRSVILPAGVLSLKPGARVKV